MRAVAGLLVCMLAVGALGCGDDDNDSTADAGDVGGTGATGGSAGADGVEDGGGAASGSGGSGGAAGAAGSAGETGGTGAAGATGGTGGSGGQDGSGPDLDEIPAMLAETMCSVVEACMGGDTVARAYGEGKCVERVLASVEDGDFPYVQDAVAAGRVEYHAEKVEACLASVQSSGCDFDTVRLFETGICAEVIAGTVEVGGSCSVDAECVGAAFCSLGGGGSACPGVCTTLLGAGQPCEDDDQCQDGLRCSDSAGICAAAAQPGAQCGGTTGVECGLGLACAGENEDEGTAGVCKALEEVFVGTLDEPCELSTTTLCEEGLSCILSLRDTDAGVEPFLRCAQRVGSGQSCNFGVPTQCPSDEYCAGTDLPGGVLEGTCQPLPAAGDDCGDDEVAGPCASGLICDEDGKCHIVNRLGGDCVSDQGCSSETCEAGVCVRPTHCEL